MVNLGRKFTCYSCHTKFYDLGKPVPTCPKCGADQRDADEAPVVTTGRGRKVVEKPVEEEFPAEPGVEEPEIEDEELVDEAEPEQEDAGDEEEEF